MFTFIDVSVSQRGIDFAAAGVDGVAVKASGANDGLYVAGGYHEHLVNARPLFGNVLHYFFNGQAAAPSQAADYFLNNLDWRPGDAVALDVEDERNRDGVIVTRAYNPDEAFEFCRRGKERNGLAPLIYGSASLLRSLDWSKCISLGCRPWPAAWGPNDGQPAAEWPDLGPQWGEAPMWQYTSLGRVPGWPTGVDLNLSRLSIQQLGGGIVSLESKAREFAAQYPTAADHPYGSENADGSWDQMCGNLMNRTGEFTTDGWAPRITGPNAWSVGLASGAMSTDASRAPAGSIHWWRNRNSTGMPGHVGLDLTGGGGNVFMATYAVRESLGSAIGIQSVAGYSNAKSFMEYMGWTTNYAGARFNTAGTAGLGFDPITNQGDILMRYFWAPNRGGMVTTETGGVFYPANTEEAIALSASYNGVDVTTRDWDVLRQAALNRAITNAGSEGNQLVAALNAAYDRIVSELGDADVDEAALAAALAPALAAQGIKADVDAAELANVLLNAQAARLAD